MGATGSKRRNSKAAASDASFAGALVRVPAHDPRWADRELAPLHAAAKTNDVAARRKMLLAPRPTSATAARALHLAAEEGHTEAAALLLDAGADVNSTNNDGWSPRTRRRKARAPTCSRSCSRAARISARGRR